MGLESANVARFLWESARRDPDFPAIRAPMGRDADGRIRYAERSFAELEAESGRTAALLAKGGVRRGTRVLLMVKPGLDLIRITFALFKIGAVPVVIDPGMGLRSFLGCVRRTEPRVLVGIPLAQWVSRIFPGTFRCIQARIQVGRKFSRDISSFPDRPFEVAEAEVSDVAAILFTSGSTGAPKGVVYRHGQFDAQVRLIRETYGIQPGEVDLPMLPVFALFNPALGMTTVVPEINPSRPAAADPAKVIQAILQNGVTNSFGSPVLWTKILKHLQKTGRRLPSLRRILMAGAPVPPRLMRDLSAFLPNATMHTPYGATEALPVSSIDHRTVLAETWAKSRDGAGTCVGHPVREVSIRVVPVTEGVMTAQGLPGNLPAGSIGEILVSGPVVTNEYDRLPEATAQAKVVDPDGRLWHRMGDVGYLDEAGRLWFCGRKVERVRTAAGTLYTDPCEAVFNDHPDVRRSALIGLGDAPEQLPAIVVEPESGKSVDFSELRELAKQHSHTREIETFFVARAFPVDVRHNAKIHRLTLARRFQKKRG